MPYPSPSLEAESSVTGMLPASNSCRGRAGRDRPQGARRLRAFPILPGLTHIPAACRSAGAPPDRGCLHPERAGEVVGRAGRVDPRRRRVSYGALPRIIAIDTRCPARRPGLTEVARRLHAAGTPREAVEQGEHSDPGTPGRSNGDAPRSHGRTP